MKDKRTEQLFSLIRNGEQLNVWDQIELVWRLGLPAIFAQISFVMVQYIDAAMVGHLGANPAASIGLVSSSLWLVWGFITSVTAGFTVQVAQRIGAKQFDEARSVLRQSLFVGGLISIAIAVVGVALSPYVPTWLHILSRYPCRLLRLRCFKHAEKHGKCETSEHDQYRDLLLGRHI